MSESSNLQSAFILAVIGGTLMVVGGGLFLMWFVWRGMMSWMVGNMGRMMMGQFMHMPFLMGLPAVGLISGTLVLIAAFLLKDRPQQAPTWGALILGFSVLSLLGMGGFLVGSLVGIIAGAIALTVKAGLQ